MAAKPEDALRLRDENQQLKRTAHELSDALKRMQAKFSMVESTMRRGEDGANVAKLVQAQTRILELEDENETLRRRNRVLTDKLRIAEETIRVKSRVHGTALPPGRVARPGSARAAPGVGGVGGGVSAAASVSSASAAPPPMHRGRPSSSSASVGGAADRSMSRGSSRSRSGERKGGEQHGHSWRHKLCVPGASEFHGGGPPVASPPRSSRPPHTPVDRSSGEGDIAALREQVNALRLQLAALRAENDSMRGQHQQPTAAVPAPHALLSAGDTAELERQLRDRSAQLLLLRSRHEHLEAKAAAERGLYDRAVNALEEQNAELRRARALLQAAEADLAMLRSRVAGAADAEEELRRARDEIRRLEGTVSELAEAPFERGGASSSTFVKDALTARQRLEGLEASDAQLRAQVSHLQATVRGTALELQTLRRERGELQALQDRLREENERLRAAADAATRANALLRERLALYSGGAGLEGAGSIPGDALSVPVEELERALAIVRRRLDRPADASADVPGLEGEPPAADAAGTVAGLRRRVQQLQLGLLTAQSELDRAERLTRSQAQISRDLAAEVADLHGRLGSEAAGLQRSLAEVTRAVAEERLQRVHMLEAEVAQLMQQAQRWRASRGLQRQAAAERRAAAAGQEEQDAAAEAAAVDGGAPPSRHKRTAAAAAAARDGDGDDDTVISGLSDDEEEAASGATASAAATANRRRRRPAAEEEGDDDEADESVGASSLTASEVYDLAGPGDNRLEVAIRGATLDPAAFGGRGAAASASGGGGPTTFALVDFMDFESQCTPLAAGTAPQYRFSAVFPLRTDALTLRHLASEPVAIEVHAARGGDYDLLASAALPLHALLGGRTRLRLPALPLRSPRDGRVVGSLRCEARLAVGLGEAWAAFARDRPAEADALMALIRRREEAAAVDVGDGAGDAAMPPGFYSTTRGGGGGGGGDNDGGATAAAALSASAATTGVPVGLASKPAPNDLLVTIVSASGLRAREIQPGSAGRLYATARPPDAYVQYTLPLPQARTAFTPVAPRAYNPVFADMRAFAVLPTAAALAALASQPLHLLLCDDSVALQPGHSLAVPPPPPDARTAAAAGAAAGTGMGPARPAAPRAVLGVASISLAPIAEGVDVAGTFEAVDERGQRVGTVTVRLMWSRPLVTVDGAPPDTLTRGQLQALAAIADRDGGGVAHALLCRLLCAGEAEAGALARLREAIAAHMRDSRVLATLGAQAAVAAAAAGGGGGGSSSLLQLGGGGEDALLAAYGSSSASAVSAATGLQFGATAGGGRRYWVHALQAAGAAAGRPGQRLTPREVYDALAAASVGVAVDLPTVEDAVLALLGDSESAVALGDLVAAAYPLPAAAAIALAKARRFMAGGPLARHGREWLLRTFANAAAAAAAAAGSGSAGLATATSTSAAPSRMPRSALAALLRDLGMLIVEDGTAPRVLSDALMGAAAGRRGRGAAAPSAPGPSAPGAYGPVLIAGGSGGGSGDSGDILSAAVTFPGGSQVLTGWYLYDAPAADSHLPPAFASRATQLGSAVYDRRPVDAFSGVASSGSGPAPAAAAAASRRGGGSAAAVGGGGGGGLFSPTDFAMDLLMAADRLSLTHPVAVPTPAPAAVTATAAAIAASAPSSSAAQLLASDAATVPAARQPQASATPVAVPAAVSQPAVAALRRDSNATAIVHSAASSSSPPLSAAGGTAASASSLVPARRQSVPTQPSRLLAPPLRVVSFAGAAPPHTPPDGFLTVAVTGLSRLSPALATLLAAHAAACTRRVSDLSYSAAPAAGGGARRRTSLASEAATLAAVPLLFLSFSLPQGPVALQPALQAQLQLQQQGPAVAAAPRTVAPARIVLCAPIPLLPAPAATSLAFSPYPYLDAASSTVGTAAAAGAGAGQGFAAATTFPVTAAGLEALMAAAAAAAAGPDSAPALVAATTGASAWSPQRAAVAALSAHLQSALAPDAEPESSDVVFTLSLLPPPPPAPPALASESSEGAATVAEAEGEEAAAAYRSSVIGAALYTLRDLLDEGADVGSSTGGGTGGPAGGGFSGVPLPLEAHPANVRALAARYAPEIAGLRDGRLQLQQQQQQQQAMMGSPRQPQPPPQQLLVSASEVAAAAAGPASSGVLADLSVALVGYRALRRLLAGTAAAGR